MPDESYWESLFDVPLIVTRLGIDRFHDVAELGCGYGTFSIPVAKAIGGTLYTFDVDVSSGIGSGSFCIDLPNSWPGNIGHSTIFQAFSVRGFFARGDKWVSLSVTLNEPLDFQPDNAELSGACRKSPAWKCPTKGIGLTPSEAVANIPGITLRPLGLSQSETKGQRRVPLLEKARLFKSDWYRSRQNSRLTSGTF